MLTWSDNRVIFKADRVTPLKITDTKLYVPLVTLSTQEKIKSPQKSKSGFNQTIKLNNYP